MKDQNRKHDTSLDAVQQRVMDAYDRNERKRDQRFRYFHRTVADIDTVRPHASKKGATDMGKG